MKDALREHWPEYLIEAWALGMFMLSAGFCATLLGSPASAVSRALPSQLLRNSVSGLAMGATAIALMQSPWGKRSGAHMNPAVTLTFLRLGQLTPWQAFFYVTAQTLGGTLGVLLVAFLCGRAFTDPPVSYAATLPGNAGPKVAFVAEFGMSCGLMLVVLLMSRCEHQRRFTGFAAGGLVALYVSFESPLSGMSMNPARTFASAVASMQWHYFWIYVIAPLAGMLTAAQIVLPWRGASGKNSDTDPPTR